MTNLVDVRNSKLYPGVTRINQVRFQQGTNSHITVVFNYNGGDASFEVYIKGSGVISSNKAPFLIECYSLLDSMLDHAEYITVEEIVDKINEIEISDWARDLIK